MLSRVSSLVRVDSAKQLLTPSLEVESTSFFLFLRFLWFAGFCISWPDRLRTEKRRRRASTWSPASQCCRGLQVRRFARGKPKLPGAAIPDKFLHPLSCILLWTVEYENLVSS